MKSSKRAEKLKYWQEINNAYEGSGLSIRAFCLSQNITYKNFLNYRYRSKQSSAPNSSLFIPVEIKAVGCWAHARRKFVEIIKANKKSRKALEAVNIIKQLYAIESEAKANQIESYRYLRYLLTELPKCKTQEQLQLLLPQHYKNNLLQNSS